MQNRCEDVTLMVSVNSWKDDALFTNRMHRGVVKYGMCLAIVKHLHCVEPAYFHLTLHY